MNNRFGRLVSALAVFMSASASAQQVRVSPVTLQTGLPAVGASVLPALTNPALSAASALPLSAGAFAAPAFIAPTASLSAAAAVPQALASGVIPAAARAVTPVGAVTFTPSAHTARVASELEHLSGLSAAHGRDHRRIFDGAGKKAEVQFVVNDEGVAINGRAAQYYQEVRRMVAQYEGVLNLEESLDVMDDSYGDVLAKVSAVEAVAKGRGLTQENTHLEETLMWVDGLLDDHGRKVAVHTHRVFFHRATDPTSEIKEGIRRVDGYIREAEEQFRRGGLAERQMGALDGVELVFDARGYQEIKDHLKMRAAELAVKTKGRINFRYLDEIAPLPKGVEATRAALNELVKRYNGEGLSKIIEGVIYSRYVGLLLELKTVEHYHGKGFEILQTGRELFDEKGQYVTELDVVARSPEGKTVLIEAKSARVPLPFEEVLRDKVIYKLDTYKKFKPQLDAMIGSPFESVVFSMDVGMAEGAQPRKDKRGRVNEDDTRKLELMKALRGQEKALSEKYGFPVSFLFLNSAPQRPAR